MEKWKSQGRGWYTTKLNSTLRIFIVIMVHGTFWDSIQVRRTSRGRLYHWAIIANDRGTAKLLSFELHTCCAIYANLVSTQVRVPPGARNFYRRKFISFFPLSSFSLCFCWNLNLILIHTGVTSRQRRVSFFDRISVGSFTLGFWIPKVSSIYLIISFAISVSPNGGRTCHRWFPRSRAQPLGHSDSWKYGVVTQLYIGNLLCKLRKSE